MNFRFIFLTCILILTACRETNTNTKRKSYQNQIKYAKTLELLECGNAVKVHIYHPENKTVKRFFLTPEKNTQTPKNYIRISTPVKSMITLSGTHIGMLSKLDGLDAICGVLDKKYIHNSIVLDRLKKKRIRAFGNEEMLRFESIVNSKAEVLIYSGFGQDFPHSKQLEKAGIICLSNYDWKENHPLGRAEWIKLFGYLIGKETKAKSYFSTIEKEYLSLKKEAKKLTRKPTVLSGNVLGDFWYAPAGESYFAELFRDAQAKYRYSETKGTGSVEMSLERILAENRTADYWLNAGFSNLELVRKSNKKASYIEAFSKEKTFCYSPNMNLFWEMSAIEPHHVLSDLLRILHPEFKQKNGMYFYQKLK